MLTALTVEVVKETAKNEHELSNVSMDLQKAAQ